MHLEVQSDLSVINLSRSQLPQAPSNGAAQIFHKFSTFETDVIEKLSIALNDVDKDSSVLVTGSYRNSPEKLRQTSDIDMILLSRSLRCPDTYVEFLSSMKEMVENFRSSTNLNPVFFTMVAGENNFIYMARKNQSQESLVPVHILYYQDESELFHLEPKGLATRLMTSAKVINGKDQYSIIPNGHPISPIEKMRWDIERSIAELILNEGTIDEDWLFSNFNSNVYISIRSQTDSLGLEGSNAKTVLNYFDPSGELVQKFGVHFLLRNDITLSNRTNQAELLEGPCAFLKILERQYTH